MAKKKTAKKRGTKKTAGSKRKTAKKTKRTKVASKKSSARRAAGARTLSTAALVKELERRQSRIDGLLAERQQVAARLDALDSEIAALGGAYSAGSSSKGPSPRATARGSRRNKLPLGDAIAEALAGQKGLTIDEIMTAVQRAGYQSKSPNFRNIASQTLGKDARFKRVGRGVYTLA